MTYVKNSIGIAALALGLTTGIQTAHAEGIGRVALFLNGTLGDKSFFDSAGLGMEKAQKELGVEGRVIEGGYDPTRWEGAMTDLADSGEYDMIISMTYDMTGPVQKLAADFPDVKFIILDSAVDYTACTCANVYSAVFRQNEGAYLAGVLSARLVEGKVGGIADGAKLGTVGGMAIPVIDDFIVGFEAGAKSVMPDIEVLRQYANSFADPATGKEIAKAEFSQGAAIVFQIAGATGQGVIEAAAEAGKYVVGVDTDQAMLYDASNPKAAASIVTSVMKNVDTVVFRSLQLAGEGKLAFGKAEALGLSEGGIGLADNKYTRAVVPAAVMDEVKAIEAKIIDGSIKVPSAF